MQKWKCSLDAIGPQPCEFSQFQSNSKRWHSLPTGGDGTNSWAWSFHAEEHQWKSCQCTNATCVIMHYGPARELNVHFSRCSRLSRFWRKNSRYPPEIQILKKNSLLDWMRFCKQILLSRVKISWEKLNFSSNSGEKSYFAVWLCFAERESILKRQFCVVEQYSNFSQQMDFGDSILKHTIFILELDIRTPLCGGDIFSFLGQKKNKTEIGMWMVIGKFLVT